MSVSRNSGTPKSSILIGVFPYKPSILVGFTPIFGNILIKVYNNTPKKTNVIS